MNGTTYCKTNRKANREKIHISEDNRPRWPRLTGSARRGDGTNAGETRSAAAGGEIVGKSGSGNEDESGTAGKFLCGESVVTAGIQHSGREVSDFGGARLRRDV